MSRRASVMSSPPATGKEVCRMRVLLIRLTGPPASSLGMPKPSSQFRRNSNRLAVQAGKVCKTCRSCERCKLRHSSLSLALAQCRLRRARLAEYTSLRSRKSCQTNDCQGHQKEVWESLFKVRICRIMRASQQRGLPVTMVTYLLEIDQN